MLSNSKYILAYLALVSLWLCPQPISAFIQDESADESLQSLVQKWHDLDAELADKELEFKTAVESEIQEELRGQYSALVDQSSDLVAQIRSKAIEALDSGDIDESTSKLLVGLAMNDAEFDRPNEAIKLGDQCVSAGLDGSLFETAAKAERLSVYSKELMEELFIRANQAKQDDLPQIKISTTKGDLVVELFEDEAPNTVANFVSLVEDKFYDGLKFHRVIEGFVAQGGDPQGNGSGGPGYTIKCECATPEARRHFFGSLSMAHAGPDTGGSQFFLCLNRTSNLDGKHTVFGRVVSGIDVLDRLSRNHTTSAKIPDTDTDVINTMEVVRKREHDYLPEKIGDESKDEESDQPPAQPTTNRETSDENQDSDERESDEPVTTESESDESDDG